MTVGGPRPIPPQWAGPWATARSTATTPPGTPPNALYTLLETQVVPEFYQRDARGIPTRWVERMRRSMATLTPQFSANRTVRQYTEDYYLPAATRYAQRATNQGAAGAAIVQQRQQIGSEWDMLGFGELQTEVVANGYLFHVPVHLGKLTPDQVLVQLYANGLNGESALRIPLAADAAGSADGTYHYQALVTTTRPAGDFTARLLPQCEGVAVPLEDDRIRWQR